MFIQLLLKSVRSEERKSISSLLAFFLFPLCTYLTVGATHSQSGEAPQVYLFYSFSFGAAKDKTSMLIKYH